MPLLELAIRRLKLFGYDEILVNIHHFGQQIIDFLEERQHFGIHIRISDERSELLDTGGGLKYGRDFFGNSPFLLYNTDVLSDIDLAALQEAHRRRGGLATLAVRARETSRYLLFDDELQLAGWRNEKDGAERWSRKPSQQAVPLAFSGIHMVEPALFDYFPTERRVFSIIDTYLTAARSEAIYGYRHDDGLWLDVGKKPALEQAASVLERIKIAPAL